LFPVKDTVCGLAPPLSLTEISPLHGEKPEHAVACDHVTVIAQEFPAPTVVVRHVFVWEKVGDPEIAMPVMSSELLPTFVSVVVCGGVHTQD
jgi:hypothetical protein